MLPGPSQIYACEKCQLDRTISVGARKATRTARRSRHTAVADAERECTVERREAYELPQSCEDPSQYAGLFLM